MSAAVWGATKLFGTEPAKHRPGYGNFAITEPPLKLVMIENPGHGGSLNHLGVGRRARLDLLLRRAGQVLGHRHPHVPDREHAGRSRVLLTTK